MNITLHDVQSLTTFSRWEEATEELPPYGVRYLRIRTNTGDLLITLYSDKDAIPIVWGERNRVLLGDTE